MERYALFTFYGALSFVLIILPFDWREMTSSNSDWLDCTRMFQNLFMLMPCVYSCDFRDKFYDNERETPIL